MSDLNANVGESSGIDNMTSEGSSLIGCGEDDQGVVKGFEECTGGVSSNENDFYVPGLGSDGREMERDGHGVSFGCEHFNGDSDGDDDDSSMFGCGSDDENRRDLYLRKCRKELTCDNGNENPLHIDSSIAFDPDDWNDFERESGEGPIASILLDDFHEQGREENLFPTSEVPEHVSVEPASIKKVVDSELVENRNVSSSVASGDCEVETGQVEEDGNILTVSFPVKGAHEPEEETKTVASFSKFEQEDFKSSDVTQNHLQDTNCLVEHLVSYTINEGIGHNQVERTTSGLELSFDDSGIEGECASIYPEEIVSTNCKNQEIRKLVEVDHPLSFKTNQPPPVLTECSKDKPDVPEPLDKMDMSDVSTYKPPSHILEEKPALVKVENIELNDEFFDEIVSEMEEILLDSSDSPGRFVCSNYPFPSQLSLPPRDGESTTSTSGTDYAYPQIAQRQKIDGIEVIGAKQKRGDVSISERLVGVKEYTVYIIRVWSGKDQWDVERRYRDFFALYRRLKSLFSELGLTLPSPWSCIEKESKKIFGNVSPDVLSDRSVLIQDCLRSILHSEFFPGSQSALIEFLYPQDRFPTLPASTTLASQSESSNSRAGPGSIRSLGKTIPLIVEIHPIKTTKQMLEAQRYTCAGCHEHFDDGMTLVRDFVKTLGWGKPRLCEYTCQLYCSSCHTNDTAILPARVLHYWDFTQYHVSQFAKSYLDSIYEQPMLCVSAVNPFLFSKVPALQHMTIVRKKVGTMLPYIRCPFRKTINKGFGSRSYLLESHDFFALKDLIDLSKGAFSALPMMMEIVSRKIIEHITEHCLICCDGGVPCNGREACEDPPSLIFPFQEGDFESCKSCKSVFHKACYRKLTNCSCGALIGLDKALQPTNTLSHPVINDLQTTRLTTVFSGGLLSRLFSKAMSGKINDHKDDNIIIMGSLPSTSL